MSMTPFVYGTTLSFGGLLLAESSLAESARLTIGDAVMIAAASNFGRMAGECASADPQSGRLGFESQEANNGKTIHVQAIGSPSNWVQAMGSLVHHRI